MGNASRRSRNDVKSDLKEVRSRLSQRSEIQVTGRYHLLPKRVSDDYDILDTVLGSGYNGQVFLATDKSTGGKVAVKPFKLLGIEAHQRRELKTEAEIFLCLDHPHVARLKDIYQEETTLFFVMECLEGGELFDQVTKRKIFTDKDAARTAYEMLLAIGYLHAKDIVHRDIKLENFMYGTKDGQLKLIDFGFSRAHKPDNKKLRMVAGTSAYMAPEVLDGSYDRKCDLWSLGVVMFVLLVGHYPFDPHDPNLRANIKSCAYTLPPAESDPAKHGLSELARDFLQKLLEVNAENRLSADEALSHPWLAVRDSSEESSPLLDEDAINSLARFTGSSRFRQHCLTLCAWSMTSDQRDEVGRLFLAVDKDKTGIISLAELKEAMVKAHNGTDVEQILAAFEVDEKEFINYSDFLAAMLSSRIDQHTELVEAAFKRFDVDGSGEIGLKDMRTMLLEHFGKKEVDNILETIDTDGNGNISYEEFLNYLSSGEAEECHVRAASTIIDDRLKANATAMVSPAITPKAPSGQDVAPIKKSRSSMCILS